MAIYQPYFYVIQDKRNGMYYAGAKWARDANPANFMVEGGYETSSETIKELIRQHGLSNFVVRKIRTFETGEAAHDYETRFLQKVDARNHSRFYNGHNNDGWMNITKMKSVMLELYGVEHASQSDTVKERVRNTNLKRLGVEYPMQSLSVRETRVRNNIDKYGVDNPAKLEDTKKKIKQTNLENFGVEHHSQSQNWREKTRKTSMEKYGVDNPSKLDSVKAKMANTKMKKYGNPVFNNREKSIETNRIKFGGNAPASDPNVLKRMSNTCLEKYGETHYAKTEEAKIRNHELKRNKANRPQVQIIKRYVALFGVRLNRGWYQSSDEKLDQIISDLALKFGSTDNKSRLV